MESYYHIAKPNTRILTLSTQQMVDCASEKYGWDNGGCHGGFIDNVLDYAKS